MITFGVKEAAIFLRIHPVTLIRMLNSGEIPGAKIGKEWVFIDVECLLSVQICRFSLKKINNKWRLCVIISGCFQIILNSSFDWNIHKYPMR